MKDWLKRGLWTFAQAAIGYAVGVLPTVDWSQDRAALKATLIGVLVSSVAGGLGALRNYINERNDW